MSHKSISQILDSVSSQNRLSNEDALFLLKNAEWTDLAPVAHQIRLQKHPENRVSYTAFRVINYTNYCNVECSFCSFMDDVGSGKGYVLSLDEMRTKALEAQKLGADQIFLQGGVNPDLPLEYYLEAIHLFHVELGMHVRGFSPVELKRMSEFYKMTLPELLQILKDAGLGSVPGAGAEILTERMRKILSPKKLSAEEWCEVMGECHKMGLPGSANIVLGSVETPEEIIEHLSYIRDQQDKTGGFLTFVPWTFQPQTNQFVVNHVQGKDYLKLLALSRMYFDNIEHIEVSVMVLGKSLAELGLHCGADDINSIVIEENVLRSQGLTTLRAAEKFIFEAGFEPVRRTLNFDFSPYAQADFVYPQQNVQLYKF
jgi:cyclic dehypoxanthinyl futalosine synthase